LIVNAEWLCVFAGNLESVHLESFDVSVVANMVKKYLRELPDPVIPEDSYTSFIEAASMCVFTYTLASVCTA